MALSFQTGNANDPFRSVANPTGSWAVLLGHFMAIRVEAPERRTPNANTLRSD